MTAIHFDSAINQAKAVREGKITALDLLDLHLERVKHLNEKVNAVVCLDEESARAQAQAADEALKSGTVGPLHGLPMTIKDSIEVAGMKTTSGNPDLREHMSTRDALAVQRLREAGAIIYGKTNLPMHGGDIQTYNEVFGVTNNPWDLTRTAGGSSGGSAVSLAMGFSALELGSDLAGSLRNPAHYNGVCAHRPTYGTVPFRGHIPGKPGSQADVDMTTLGPMSRYVADLQLALDVIAGPDSRDMRGWHLTLPEPTKAVRDMRVAIWYDHPICPVDQEVRSILKGLGDKLSAEKVNIVEIESPFPAIEDHYTTYLHLLYSVSGAGFPAKLKRHFDQSYESLTADQVDLRSQMIRGVSGRHRHWQAAHEKQQQQRLDWDRFFEKYDVLICPVSPTPAYVHQLGPMTERTVEINGKPHPYAHQFFWASFAANASLPATSVPVGLTENQLPVGIQITASYLNDRTTLAFGKWIEDLFEGFQVPPLAKGI
jgi:amidase